MVMVLEVNGASYSNWSSTRISRSMENISGHFRFSATSSPELSFPVKPGDAVKVKIGTKVVLTGYVDSVEVSYSASDHTIHVEGRDKTADIVDSKVDHKIEFHAPITLEDVVSQTLSSIGASDVSVINKVGDLEPFTAGELISAHIGQSAYDFMELYARKRQVLLTTDGLGNIVFVRASEEDTGLTFISIPGDSRSNILSAEVRYNDEHRYNLYKFYSQGNPGGNKYLADSPSELTNKTGQYIDSKIRSSRQYHEIAEASTVKTTLEARAKWEGQVREAKSLKYTCKVAGHTYSHNNNAAYMPNMLVNVSDQFANLYRSMLITEVSSEYNVSSGSITTLTLLPPEAFALLEEDRLNTKEKRAARRAARKAKHL